MKIYIASKYIDHREINRRIYAALIAGGFDAFYLKLLILMLSLMQKCKLWAKHATTNYQVAMSSWSSHQSG